MPTNTDSTAQRLDRIESALCDLHSLSGWWFGGHSLSDEGRAAHDRLDALVVELRGDNDGGDVNP
jgi:hypothetical protein